MACRPLREIIFDTTTSDAAIAAVIGTRCYPDRIPEDATFPLIVFQRISSNSEVYREHTIGNTGRTESRVQFDAYAETGDDAGDLADLIYALWDGYKSGDCEVGYAFRANRISTREDGINKYRAITDIIIEHCTA